MGVAEAADFDTLGFYTGNSNHERIINELSWEIGDRRSINPYSLKLTFEHSGFEGFDSTGIIDLNYLRANLEWKSAYYYDSKRKFQYRIYIGGFLKNDNRNGLSIKNGAYNLTGQGFNDYRWDELYFGRTETSGFMSRQVTEREGGMKAALGSAYSEGRSNSFIFAINLKSDLPQNLPLNLPIQPYFDLGYYKDTRQVTSGSSESKELWYQFGFTVEALQGAVGIHFPVANSKHLKDLLNQSGQDHFFNRISFTLDLYKLNPWEIVDNIEF